MDTEASSAPSSSNRPRPWLLVLLGLVLVGALVYSMRDSAGPAAPASNPGRPQQAPASDELNAPDVKLEALKQTLPPPGETERNPFRFRPKPPPPPPPGPPPGESKFPAVKPIEPTEPPGPPPPPPIPLKFIGVTEAAGVGKIAALSDCRHTVQGVEGDVIDGRYRIVKIGVESLVIEYLDGKGRTTLRMSGQECVSK